jgi:hypothetical protein
MTDTRKGTLLSILRKFVGRVRGVWRCSLPPKEGKIIRSITAKKAGAGPCAIATALKIISGKGEDTGIED